MMETEPVPLGDVIRFTGAGLYAIYYHGDHPAYQGFATMMTHPEDPGVPIYVGKAVPAGGRRGLDSPSTSQTTALFARIREHGRSVSDAENLDLDHFGVRWLVVDDIWIPLGESALIRQYRPVWNAVIDGFGNHDPGAGRRAGVRSRWDTLHPGRPWLSNFPERPETAAEIEQEVREYLRSRLH